MLRKYQRNWVVYLAGLLLVLAALDTKDTINHIRKNVIKENNLTAEPVVKQSKALLQGIDVAQYQAVLPVPYYHVGSESYNLTIDPEDNFGNETMRFSLVSGLPLMSNKMSRSPPVHAELLFSIFTEAGISAELKHKLGKKPVLVLLNKTFYDGRSTYGNNLTLEPAKSVLITGQK
ncbi:hypothetical protein [Adhaeribacter soli]|uniref:Uncharacterized protein n=1 Tax=Adhaeribacter soli TaxID=2607655 RepID=A0A5N1IQR9_9BACT|nr:hypothetical protein [Adhaeribacter soli]KAA9331875.1 hypothetical protein F0P94_13840 [Adhaeribacter soli]